MNSVLATARHQIQQMKERSKAELKQALEDLLEGEDGVSVSRGLIVLKCDFLFLTILVYVSQIQEVIVLAITFWINLIIFLPQYTENSS